MSTQIVPVALRKGAAEIPTTIEVADTHIVSKVGASKPKAQNAIDSNHTVPTPKAGPWQNGSLQIMIGKQKQPWFWFNAKNQNMFNLNPHTHTLRHLNMNCMVVAESWHDLGCYQKVMVLIDLDCVFHVYKRTATAEHARTLTQLFKLLQESVQKKTTKHHYALIWNYSKCSDNDTLLKRHRCTSEHWSSS